MDATQKKRNHGRDAGGETWSLDREEFQVNLIESVEMSSIDVDQSQTSSEIQGRTRLFDMSLGKLSGETM